MNSTKKKNVVKVWCIVEKSVLFSIRDYLRFFENFIDKSSYENIDSFMSEVANTFIWDRVEDSTGEFEWVVSKFLKSYEFD